MTRLKQLRSLVILAAFTIIILSLNSCAIFQSIISGAGIKEPEADFVNARLSGLSFDAVDFLFDLKIKNPNKIGIKLAKLDYEFFVNESSFLKGIQDKGIEIVSMGEQTVQFPISLRFSDLYQTFQTLKSQGLSNYRMNFGLSFDLPVLGALRIPLSKSGDFPLVKLPKISFSDIRIERLSLSGADLRVGLNIDNPNIFSVLLGQMNYQLNINGLKLISGKTDKKAQIKENGKGVIDIPFSLDFMQIGRSFYQILSSKEKLSYQMTGNLDIETSHELLKQVSLPFDLSGVTELLSD